MESPDRCCAAPGPRLEPSDASGSNINAGCCGRSVSDGCTGHWLPGSCKLQGGSRQLTPGTCRCTCQVARCKHYKHCQ
eukprot:6586135-Alexandrium_andersonii.AAC.1